ncbi:MAG: tetratricopeptide repeat protein [Acidobacteria bacterium]|nr:tetratricopeptide repeat protein [Acidobacteriota bacterium]
MASRRITRKEMKRDDFVSAMGRLSLWMEEHVKEALFLGGAVLAVVIGSIFLVQYLNQREAKASVLLGRGLEMLHAPVQGDGSAPTPGGLSYASEQEKLQAVIAQMDSLRQSYPRSRSGRLALYYKGLALDALGRSEEAIKTLSEFLEASPDNYAAPMAQAAMARMLQSAGQSQKALEILERLSKQTTGAYPPQAALMEMGRCLEGMGKKDEARKVYERLTKEFPNSDYSREAQERLKGIS